MVDPTPLQPAPITAIKKTFSIKDFRLESGRIIHDLTFGYETYGTLNDPGDNGIFVCPFLTATSHCAGVYAPTDKTPGYADLMIGRGKPIDTERYFVVSVDGLCNVNISDQTVSTTGPATIDPATGRPFGMRFPVVSHRDQVRAQKALLDHLGVSKLKLVMGISMGGAQTMQWGALYPDFVERLLPIKGRALRTPSLIVAAYDTMMKAITNDPDWMSGDYYPGRGPVRGLNLAMRNLVQLGQSFLWADQNGGRQCTPTEDPLDSLENDFAIVKRMDYIAAVKASKADANSFIYLCRSEQLFAIDERGGSIKDVKSPTLFIVEGTDIFAPNLAEVELAVERLRESDVPAFMLDIKAGLGHYTEIPSLSRHFPIIRAFLEHDFEGPGRWGFVDFPAAI